MQDFTGLTTNAEFVKKIFTALKAKRSDMCRVAVDTIFVKQMGLPRRPKPGKKEEEVKAMESWVEANSLHDVVSLCVSPCC